MLFFFLELFWWAESERSLDTSQVLDSEALDGLQLFAASSSRHLGNRHSASETVCPQWKEIKTQPQCWFFVCYNFFWMLTWFRKKGFATSLLGSGPCAHCVTFLLPGLHICFYHVLLWGAGKLKRKIKFSFLNESQEDCVSHKFLWTASKANLFYNLFGSVWGVFMFLKMSLPVGVFFHWVCSISLVTVALLWKCFKTFFQVQY